VNSPAELNLPRGPASNVPMLHGIQTILRFAVALAIGCSAWWSGVSGSSSAQAAESNDAVVGSLQAALTKNIGHARNWLEQADYKSLNQSAGGLQLLAALLKARSDDAAWQAAVGKVEAAVAEVQAAAKSDDAGNCRASLGSLEKSAAAMATLKPTGQPLSAPRAPAIRPLMLVMDSIYADAKIALIAGNVASAKKQAFVLAELGGLVSNSRQSDEWLSLAGEFTKAASTAAASAETDPPTVRQLLRGISQRCEACHETRTR
jgi:cytochrome c556